MKCPIARITGAFDPRPAEQGPSSGMPLFRLGFRPFFLFGSLYGLIAIGYFILLLSGMIETFPSAWDIISWHRHEMLFGFTGAIVAGFLLTAVPNWTGKPTVKGKILALIVVLWLAGRGVVFFSTYLPATLVALVDAAFFLACAGAILPALIRSGNRRNYFFVGLLALLSVANGMTHRGHADAGISLGIGIVILMMIVIGGRVIPFFTERPLGLQIRRDAKLDRFIIVSAILPLALEILGVEGMAVGIFFLMAAAANFMRLSLWHSFKTMKTPLLWVLHAGYAWLIVGLAMKAAYHLGFSLLPSLATHAFTAGAIGMLTLGMMARVSLGHTGRPLAVGPLMNISFHCMNLAAIFRVFGVLLLPQYSTQWWQAASLFWVLALGIFVMIYAPILTRPRCDGRDG